MFEILIHQLAEEELAQIRKFDRNHILDQIEANLRHQPDLTSRRRKRLQPVIPTFEAVPPIWQLRVGDYRVFYDVDRESRTVHVRAVRIKGTQSTEEIL